jgi:hypothetical protein
MTPQRPCAAVAAIIITAALSSRVCQSQPPGASLRAPERTSLELSRGGKAKTKAMKGLTVRFPYSQVWIPRGGQSVEYGLCAVLFDGKEPTQGFFEVGENACEVIITSSNPEVAEAKKDSRHLMGPFYFVFKKPGHSKFTVQVGQYSASHEIEVKEAPVAPGDATDIAIKELGFPSLKQKIFVDWPKTETHDGFTYTPTAGDPFIGEHWWCQKHRDLVLSVEDGKVVNIGTNRRRTDNQKEIRVLKPNVK